MTLLSNVADGSHQNTIGNFTTRLPQLSLDNKWVVGLSEIRYTNSWYNLKDYNKIDVFDKERVSYLSRTVFLSPGRFTDPREVIIEIMRLITSASKESVVTLPTISFNPFSHKIALKAGKCVEGRKLKLFLSRELNTMLGLDGGLNLIPTANGDDEREANNSCDMTGGINSLLLYCDVVDYSIVGNVKAQLLRVVKIPPKSVFGENVVVTYDKPHYIKLSIREFQSIEVHIKDDVGDTIDFKSGRVIITLHFMRNDG